MLKSIHFGIGFNYVYSSFTGMQNRICDKYLSVSTTDLNCGYLLYKILLLSIFIYYKSGLLTRNFQNPQTRNLTPRTQLV